MMNMPVMPEVREYGVAPAARYVATNRFKVKRGAGAKFEKRWADRKSRLATLKGFRLFSLLQKVDENSGQPCEGEFANYISCTVWKSRENFDAWRTGDAFKEAHGGGRLSGFVGLLTTALFILDGGPKPAFYEGMEPFVTSCEKIPPKLVAAPDSEGWRSIEADGVNCVEPDVFVFKQSFAVKEGKEAAFEKALITEAEKKAKNEEGLVLFCEMLRRDGGNADDGFQYSILTWYNSKEAYDKCIASVIPPADCVIAQDTATYQGKLTMVSPKGG
jgi:heme-degrading monooxygenase HmoA